jgi:hypothetical protein
MTHGQNYSGDAVGLWRNRPDLAFTFAIAIGLVLNSYATEP